MAFLYQCHGTLVPRTVVLAAALIGVTGFDQESREAAR